MKRTKGKGGQNGKIGNLFTHVVKCAYCGGPMCLVDRSRATRSYPYLICDNGRRGVGCARHTVRYDECELLILENCHKLEPDRVLPNPDDQAINCGLLRQSIDSMNTELTAVEQQIENLTDQITRTQSQTMRDRYEGKIETLFEQEQTIRAELATTIEKLADAEKGLESLSKWKQSLGLLIESLKDENPELRSRLRAHLRDLISKIEVFSVGHSKEFDPDAAVLPKETSIKRKRQCRDGDDIADYLYSVSDQVSPEFDAFVRDLVKRRMSKEGRFLRVYFKTGMSLDLVPPGSLASGMELCKEGPDKGRWKLVSPAIAQIWEEFSSRTPDQSNCRSARLSQK